MLGLQTQESPKFERSFQMIQNEAAKQNAVFFAFAGDGHDGEFPDLECEDMMGWLIPNERVAEFQPEWEKDNSETALERWSRFFTFADWSEVDGSIIISFNNYG